MASPADAEPWLATVGGGEGSDEGRSYAPFRVKVQISNTILQRGLGDRSDMEIRWERT